MYIYIYVYVYYIKQKNMYIYILHDKCKTYICLFLQNFKTYMKAII